MSIIGDGIMLGAGGETASILVYGLSETDTVTASKDGKTVIGKWTQIPNPAYVVPDGYTQLEYIESTGTQYIQTGISAPNGFRISCEIMNKLGAYSTICAARPTNANVDNNGLYWEGSSQIGVGAGGWATGGSRVTNKKYQVDASTIVGNLFFKLDDVSQSFSFNPSYPQTNQRSGNLLTLFATITMEGEVKGFAQDTLYAAKIYTSIDDSELVGDFIPCKRTSDNAIGLYDLVSNSFFENAGTGTFTAGAEVSQTIDGFLIDKIKDYGTWTVTATNGTKTAMQDVLVDAADVFNVDIKFQYYTEQQLLDMGVRISRTIGDKIKRVDRYIQRVESTPLAVCGQRSADGEWLGYAIISNKPVTESFIMSNYGAISGAALGSGLTAYVYCMMHQYKISYNPNVYLNDNIASYVFDATWSNEIPTISDSYIETVNHIAESIPNE